MEWTISMYVKFKIKQILLEIHRKQMTILRSPKKAQMLYNIK